MNINKILIAFLFLFLFFLSPVKAEDTKDLPDEELPAINPFLSGAGAGSTNGEGLSTDGITQSGGVSLKNFKLNGVIIGESKKFAIFSFPDGRTVKYEEDTILSNNLMILDIFSDRVYIKINDVEHSIDLKNNLVKTEGWHLI